MTTHAIKLADEVFSRLQAVGGFTSYHRAPVTQVNPGDLPLLGVFLMRENMTADGDENAGEPHYIHRLTLGITGAISATAPEAQLIALELVMSQILEALLQDASLFNQEWIDGIPSIDRRLNFTRIGETPLAEVQVELVIKYGSRWEPTVTDDFEAINYTVTPKL